MQHYFSQSYISKLILPLNDSGFCNAHFFLNSHFPMIMHRFIPSNAWYYLSHQAPQGVHVVCKSFPRIKIVTSEIESGLNKDFHVIPRMGEFGDRYFGTDDDDHQVMAPSQ